MKRRRENTESFKDRQRKGLQRSRNLKRRATKPEKVLMEHLEKFDIWYKFQGYFHDGVVLYIPDFYISTAFGKVVIEIDGANHANQREYDERRTRWLKKNRVREVIRFNNEHVLADPYGVIRDILKFKPRKISQVSAERFQQRKNAVDENGHYIL